jgi:hypothetical protein
MEDDPFGSELFDVFDNKTLAPTSSNNKKKFDDEDDDENEDEDGLQ